MKKLINHDSDVVEECLEGMALAHPELHFSTSPSYVTRQGIPITGKVAVVSGGGSGHEPLHIGYVGRGMLDGACPGQIFSAPTPDQILACSKAVNSGSGVLFIVKNYTGDVLSFETAIELLHAEGIPVANVLVDDDISQSVTVPGVGRRAMGSTIVIEKIVGAAAERKQSLDQCVHLAHEIITNSWSIGVALTSCTVPHRGVPTFDLDPDKIELGIGIHGERGQSSVAYQPADEVVTMLFNKIMTNGAYTRHLREWNRVMGGWMEVELQTKPLQKGDQVIAIVSSMGSTPSSELYIVYRKLAQLCQGYGIRIVRRLVGTYLTSLDMQGCTITLVRINEEMLRLWDDPVDTVTLRWGIS